MHIDIDSRLLFGGKTEDVTAPSNRTLTSTSKKKVDVHLQHLWKHLKDHKVPERIEKLQEASNQGEFLEHHIEECNKTDWDLGRGMPHAEKQCGKRSHGHAFSPILAEAGLTVRHWRTKRSGVKNDRNVTNRLRKAREQTELIDPGTTDLEGITKKLKEAWKELKRTCNVAREERDAFLHERATE